MRNFVKISITIGIFIVILFVFKNFYKESNIIIKDSKLQSSIKYNGLVNAKDFALDDEGNFYIAYVDKIQFIDKNGKSYDLIKNKDFNINTVEYNKGKLYFSSNSKIFSYDLNKKQQKVLIDDLPSYGDYKESLIKIAGNELFVSIGAATNSGVVGKDNVWLKNYPFYYDISPKDITIKGGSFGSEKSGAFVPYKTKNISGQLISGHFPGNASIIHCDLTNGYGGTFAWGIRNVKGMAFNSEGKLIASVGGMEDRGLRPVKGDVDYIYEIKNGTWYGWPDYSGGDPVTSPRFKGQNNSTINFILDNHPTTNPQAPIYQHKYLSSIGSLDIDTLGYLGERDCIYFYDARDNIIYGLSKTNILSSKAAFEKNTNISRLKFYIKNLYVLESKNGILYNITLNNNDSASVLSKNIIYYFMLVVFAGIVLVIWKANLNNK